MNYFSLYFLPPLSRVPRCPKPFDGLATWDRLLLLRATRPDRMIECLKTWVAEELGEQYVAQQPFDMRQTYVYIYQYILTYYYRLS